MMGQGKRSKHLTEEDRKEIQSAQAYILKKQQAMNMCTKVEQKLVSGIIGSFEDLGDMAEPEEIEVDPESLIYSHQIDVDFEGKGRGKAHRNRTAQYSISIWIRSVPTGNRETPMRI